MGANNKKTKKRKRELKEYLSLESLQTVKKTLLSWLKKVTEKASLLKKTVIFYFYISRLTVKTYFRFRILHFLNAKRMLIGSVVYFSLLLGSIFLFGQFIDPVFARSDAITGSINCTNKKIASVPWWSSLWHFYLESSTWG